MKILDFRAQASINNEDIPRILRMIQCSSERKLKKHHFPQGKRFNRIMATSRSLHRWKNERICCKEYTDQILTNSA